jgi:hypothetical protein
MATSCHHALTRDVRGQFTSAIYYSLRILDFIITSLRDMVVHREGIMTRFILSFALVIVVTTAPAIAGTDAGEAPNPFTDPTAGAIPYKGLGYIAVPVPLPLPLPAPGQTSVQMPPVDEAKSFGAFYQARKKDSDGH